MTMQRSVCNKCLWMGQALKGRSKLPLTLEVRRGICVEQQARRGLKMGSLRNRGKEQQLEEPDQELAWNCPETSVDSAEEGGEQGDEPGERDGQEPDQAGLRSQGRIMMWHLINGFVGLGDTS